MYNKKYFIFLLIIFSFTISQNKNSFLWQGISVNTSDNIDALNLNPAGLGVEREKQFAFSINQLSQNDKKLYIGMINRYKNGFAIENYYDNKFQTALGYGFSPYENIYLGVKYHQESDYSIGTMLRPHNSISLGYTKFSCSNTCYDLRRYGFAIKPFVTFDNYKEIDSSKFLKYSNFTIGYDKTKDRLNKTFQEQFFISTTVIPGIELSILKYSGSNTNRGLSSKDDSYAIKIGVNFGSSGFSIQNSASNSFYSDNKFSTTSLVYFDYSQKLNSFKPINVQSKENYIKMKLDGLFIEEKPTVNPFDFVIDINPFPFGSSNQTGQQLKQWIDYLKDITNNPEIDGLIIELGYVQAGFGKKKEMYNALLNFKNAGKKIIVYADNYISNSDYYLISMADEIYMHRMGIVDLRGLNMEITFLRGLLDTVSIVPEVIRVSPYKTYADPLLNRNMSEEMRENYTELSDDLYNIMVNDIAVGKNITKDEALTMVNNGPYLNTSYAIEGNVIKDTMFPDEFEDYINNINNEKVNFIDSNSSNTTSKYVYDWKPEKKPKIAIIYAVGGIVSGKSNPGPAGSSLMGDETIKKAIKKAREDDDVKAIVFRIDSGGGSALASDMMWKEIYNSTVKDTSNIKPFIVSMSDVAASGGYYIACQADSIVADATTITGSIGVIYARLNFSKLLNRIGINTENVKNGNNADFGSMSRLFTDEEKEKIAESIMDTYDIFKQRVVDGRKNLNDTDALDEIALGRVWTGDKALEHGLIDKIGGLHDAIDVAKNSSGIDLKDDIEIIELPYVKSFNLLNMFNKQEATIKVKKLSYIDFFPKEIADELEALDIIPIIENDNIQFLMPYKINFK